MGGACPTTPCRSGDACTRRAIRCVRGPVDPWGGRVVCDWWHTLAPPPTTPGEEGAGLHRQGDQNPCRGGSALYSHGGDFWLVCRWATLPRAHHPQRIQGSRACP